MTTLEGLHYRDNTPVAIEIHNDKIARIIRKPSLADPANAGLYIAPGLIDNQVNGYAGVSFGFGGTNDLTLDGIRRVTQALWRDGVTTFLPTLTSNSQDVLIKNLRLLAQAMNDPDCSGSIAGFHLEGPYISPQEGYRGAHPAKWVRPPDWDEFCRLNEAAGSHIRQVSLAPELPGAMEFIRNCRKNGIIVALGHHNAPAEVIAQAIDEGAVIATHLGNGCANRIDRHDNVFWPQLADDRLLITIICDGFHLRPEEIRVFYKVKGKERIVLISDVTHFAALPPGIYRGADGEEIELTTAGKLHYPACQVLYGSAAPLRKGVGHIMQVTGCSLGDAIQMASGNPAKIYGLHDRGALEPGCRADIIMFTIQDHQLHIKKTLVAGQVVFEQN
ncbi:MAG TPA: N-acetylglucosamine-6-phosphate deacetylase [bacterium]|mgnify:CR=1 FL=1|nr:N-acetylglucosamine-6-phosphate deacetylase [bacterium]HPN45901.1 N-acetylglucosamine-6-phosphate deacetylase [bacterium]